jgi:hypothetical protein
MRVCSLSSFSPGQNKATATRNKTKMRPIKRNTGKGGKNKGTYRLENSLLKSNATPAL